MVLHCDADAFFCQVERSRDPSLASVPALAVRQHGDVISVDAGARAAGVTRDDSPSAAREKLRAVGGVLAHVHVVEGHRVSYRPYLAASAALVRLLASEETAEAVARATRRGSDGTKGTSDAHAAAASHAKSAVAPAARVSAAPALTVEKASIDEAYVQLPAGASLDRDARRAADAIRTLARERLGLVVSVGAASNKFLAKRASATCKPDGVAIVASDEDVAAVLAKTPAWKLPGCGGGGVASRMQTALGARTASDVATKTPSALVAALGLAPAVAERAVLAARGVCDAPVVPRGTANGTVGVHATLTVTPRRMPARPGFEPVTSASGGRAGMFEPLRVGERDRADGLVDAMARDLAGRVCDDAAAEKRWPRTLTATVATKIAPDAATTTKSKSRAFPARVTKRESDATRRATRDVGDAREGVSSGQGSSERDVANAVAEACRALVRAATTGADAETLVTKVSLTATGFKPERSGDAVLARAFRKGAGTTAGTTAGTGAGTGAGTAGLGTAGLGCGSSDLPPVFPPPRPPPFPPRPPRPLPPVAFSSSSSSALHSSFALAASLDSLDALASFLDSLADSLLDSLADSLADSLGSLCFGGGVVLGCGISVLGCGISVLGCGISVLGCGSSVLGCGSSALPPLPPFPEGFAAAAAALAAALPPESGACFPPLPPAAAAPFPPDAGASCEKGR